MTNQLLYRALEAKSEEDLENIYYKLIKDLAKT